MPKCYIKSSVYYFLRSSLHLSFSFTFLPIYRDLEPFKFQKMSFFFSHSLCCSSHAHLFSLCIICIALLYFSSFSLKTYHLPSLWRLNLFYFKIIIWLLQIPVLFINCMKNAFHFKWKEKEDLILKIQNEQRTSFGAENKEMIRKGCRNVKGTQASAGRGQKLHQFEQWNK